MTTAATTRRLAVSFYAAPDHCSLEEFCRLLAERGIGGIGLTARAVEAHTPVELERLLRSHDLTCTSLNSAGYFLHADPEAAHRQERLERLLLDAALVLGAPVNVIPGGLHHARARGEPVALAEVRRRAQDGLERLAQRMAVDGIRLSLEPIRPLGLTDKGCINQLSHARAAIAGLPGAGLTLDLFHSWWDADLSDTVATAVEDLHVVQVCGVETWPSDTPPARTDLALGTADVRGFLAELTAAGYSGLLEYEVMQFQRAQEVVGLLDRAVADFVALQQPAPPPPEPTGRHLS